MSDERPEALLKSALERIIYFEARSEALHNDLAASRDEVERLKVELTRASQREIELRRTLAEAQVEATRSHREREELGRMNDALRAERGALIEKFIEAARIQSADVAPQEGEFDLASFIALLRSEAMGRPKLALQEPAPRELQPPPAPEPQLAPQTVAHAERLRSEGRLEVRDVQLTALTALPGRTEETLFGFSLRELSAPEPTARCRAADRLKALGQAAAAPALATALHRETEGRVLVALLSAFSELAGRQGVPVVAPHLRAEDPDVRIAALKALLALDATQGAPHLSAAMKDPDGAVRRRATLLALGLTAEAALDLGREALGDVEAEVRSVGALALGAAGGEGARALLLKALDDREEKVRSAAARSLSRVLGEDVRPLIQMEEGQRRREIRRLAQLPARPAIQAALEPRQAVVAKLKAGTRVAGPLPAGVTPTSERLEAIAAPASAAINPEPAVQYAVATARASASPAHGGGDTRAIHPAALPTLSVQTAAQMKASPPSGVSWQAPLASTAGSHLAAAVRTPAREPRRPSEPSKALLSDVLTELRRSLRGLTLSDLAAQSGRAAPDVDRACQALLQRGEIVRRGIKYFMA